LDVAFTDMAEAFAGVMVRTAAPERGEVFDARAVEQRSTSPAPASSPCRPSSTSPRAP
jgi:hypothetical protein